MNGSPGRRRRRIVARSLAAVAVPLAVAAGCSISTDDTPRGLAVSTTTTSAPASPTSGGASAQLWYVLDGSLVPVSASLPDHLLSTVMGSLFDAPDTESVGRDLTTSVPVDTKVEHLDLADGTLTVDLSGEFDNLVGPSRQQAIAQIVLTATEFPSVERVRFRVDGTAVPVPTPTRGDAPTVSECDYASLLADPVEMAQAGVTLSAIQRTQARAADLERHCDNTG
ncbi:MAG: hypothetical protein EKK62_03335 [Acidimicrobiia bacterium]|nr:MAG: hypothetical protein EKK62_03335 [Acidimicrobiia bacterium]